MTTTITDADLPLQRAYRWERERANQYWAEGRWELQGNRWIWVEGSWQVRAATPAGPQVRDHRH